MIFKIIFITAKPIIEHEQLLALYIGYRATCRHIVILSSVDGNGEMNILILIQWVSYCISK